MLSGLTKSFYICKYPTTLSAYRSRSKTLILPRLRLYERHQDLQSVVPKEAKEGWLDSNIWSILIDACIAGHDGLFLQRFIFLWQFHINLVLTFCSKEVQSSSLNWRSKQQSLQSQGTTAGSRLDGLMYTLKGPRLEFGAVEVSSTFKDTTAPKWTNDSRKLLATLHAMAVCTSDLVKHDESTMRAVQFLAFIHAGT